MEPGGEHGQNAESLGGANTNGNAKRAIAVLVFLVVVLVATGLYLSSRSNQTPETGPFTIELESSGEKSELLEEIEKDINKERALERRDRIDYVDANVFAIWSIEGVGLFLADAQNGMSLYVERDDSVCTEDCFNDMIPFVTDTPYTTLPDGSDNKYLKTIELPDGTYQYTWDEEPLYHFKLDREPTDVRGAYYFDSFDIATIE